MDSQRRPGGGPSPPVVGGTAKNETRRMRRFEVLCDEERADRYKALAKKALLAYGLTPDLTYVGQGTHTVFRAFVGGGAYAVRIGEAGRDLALIRRELLWLAALGRDTPLGVPEPILTLHGDLFSTVSMEGVPGTRSCSVVRWVEGERREAELTTDEVAAMGRLAAALHRHADTFRWPEEITPVQDDAQSRAFTACDALRPTLDAPGDASLLADAAARIADAIPPSALGGPIHGDLRLRKLRLDHGVAGVLGFAHCRLGADLEDLSVLWMELDGRRSTLELRSALLEGYRTVRSLPAACEDSLGAYGALRALEDAARELNALGRDRRSRGEAAERVATDLRRALSVILGPAGA